MTDETTPAAADASTTAKPVEPAPPQKKAEPTAKPAARKRKPAKRKRAGTVKRAPAKKAPSSEPALEGAIGDAAGPCASGAEMPEGGRGS